MTNTSSPDENGHEKTTSSGPDNPFVTFRRLVDEQISALLHHFTGLPSAGGNSQPSARNCSSSDSGVPSGGSFFPWVHDAHTTMAAQPGDGLRRETQREELGAWPTCGWWLKQSEDPSSAKERSSQETWARDERSLDEDRFRRCVRRFFWEPGAPLHWGVVGLGPDISFPRPPWFLPYVLVNSYSPLHLEQQARYRQLRWKEAFEDLLFASGELPSPMNPARNNHHESSGAWVRNLFDHSASLGDRTCYDLPPTIRAGDDGDTEEGVDLRRLIEAATAIVSTEDSEYAEEGQTELDAFRQFMDHSYEPPFMSAPTLARDPARLQQLQESGTGLDECRTDDELKQSSASVIATLTTTQQVVDPDGKVHTRVVLKKRFADGREENRETIHTTHSLTKTLLPDGSSTSPTTTAFVTSDEGQQQKQKQKQKQASVSTLIPESSPTTTRTTTTTTTSDANKNGKERKGWFWSG